METPSTPTPVENQKTWHVVVDTNVLLESLRFVHQLRDTSCESMCFFFLI